MATEDSSKFQAALRDTRKSRFAHYRDIYYGRASLGFVIKAEMIIGLFGSMPGGIGLFLRHRLYRGLFGAVGKNLLVGRNVTIRHPKKIRLGSNVILDDNCVIDAKGDSNQGITIGDNVYIGRNTIIYCKNGDLSIGSNVSFSANCTAMASSKLSIGDGAVIGAYCYFLNGGDYDYGSKVPFCEQSAFSAKEGLTIGRNCWFGTGVTVLDGASIGDHCVVGAHSLVKHAIPSDSLAYGTPARVAKKL
jgi:acetyltransferase-like isoleucine patch superfamily enzyme